MWTEITLLQSAVISEQKYELKFIGDKIPFTTNFTWWLGSTCMTHETNL